MSIFYIFPKQVKKNKIISKNRIYNHSKTSKAVQELFVKQIDKIIWDYTLSAQTLNIGTSKTIVEIQIFMLKLREEKLDNRILEIIDKAIPSPLLFILSYEKQIQYRAAYKRTNKLDKTKQVQMSYFATNWVKEDIEKQTLPITGNMEELYENLLCNIIPHQRKEQEIIEEFIKRAEKQEVNKKKIEELERQVRREKQFNRKIELSKQIKKLRDAYIL